MPSTNTQRQAAYRARHLQCVDGQGMRLNTILSVDAKYALERLASAYGLTQRAMLERLIVQAEQATVDALPPQRGVDRDYYDKRLSLPADIVTP